MYSLFITTYSVNTTLRKVASMSVSSLFGSRLRDLRIDAGLTQESLCIELSSKFNLALTRSAISQYENNARIPDVHIIIYLSKYFKCSSDYLLGLSEYKNTEDALKEYLRNLMLNINS